MIKFRIHTDIDKMQNDIYHGRRLCRAPNSEKKKKNVKMALSLELSGIF